MSNRLHRSTWKVRVFRRLRAEDRASQIVEFALSLPLLVLFVVGIFDFSGAISLKQKLTNAAREAARVAAADPANDLSSPSLRQSLDAIYVVDNYLVSEKINDCGLGGGSPSSTDGSPLTWIYSASGSGCPGSGITIHKPGLRSTIPSGGNTVNLVETCVTIHYPYKWQYSSVTGLLGITFVGPTGITTTASAFNEN